jgi:hypothetical protein
VANSCAASHRSSLNGGNFMARYDPAQTRRAQCRLGIAAAQAYLDSPEYMETGSWRNGEERFLNVMRKPTMVEKIPGSLEWAGYENDIDARHAHSSWFGKSLDDMQAHFPGGRSIERGDELLFMPRGAFQFYIFAFARYVMSEAAIGDADAASSFLGFLAAREKRDPGSVAQVLTHLAPTIDFVAASQARYDASHDIYGDFTEKAAKIKELCGRAHSQRDPEDQMLDPTDDA